MRKAGAAGAEAPPLDDLFNEPDDGMGPGLDLPPPPTGKRREGVRPEEIAAVEAENLTARQLRMARRMALKQGIAASSDPEAVVLLRRKGIDPFQRTTVMDLVVPRESEGENGENVQLPQRIKPISVPSTEQRAEESHLSDLIRIQRDIARRRRRKLIMLALRLAVFVLLPTFVVGWYYFRVATPMYEAHSEFVIQQAMAPQAASGGGGLLTTSSAGLMGVAQDSIAVQGYLQSREAMLRLNNDLNFAGKFVGDHIDALQRLPDDATTEAIYGVYKDNVQIAYDPTEGIVKMDVTADDPHVAVAFSNALIGYAEEQVDQLTQRMRADQMAGAQAGYEKAEANMLAANQKLVDLQERFSVLSSDMEVSLVTSQIGTLQSQILEDRLSLAQIESNPTPNEARAEPLRERIDRMQQQIADLRGQLTSSTANDPSIARLQSELLVAQSDIEMRQTLLAQSLEAMEAARVEATRQTRYLSRSVNPTPPDEATYPRAFENTLVALLIFLGIYLMISMTAAILREQVSS
ncbi:capsule biosynthesis protein [Falsirhodobacter algicola]|nr:capsule biosynthesis protein [Falsirhodobacter algicola]